jgi:hypothetical protein
VIQRQQLLEHQSPNLLALYLAIAAVFDLAGDPISEFIELVTAYRALPAGPTNAIKELLSQKWLALSVALQDHKFVIGNLFYGGEPVLARRAFATPADHPAFVYGTAVYDSIFIMPA